MQALQDIQNQIAVETKELKQPELGEKKIEIIRPFATEFLELLSQNTSEAEPLLKHPFTKWLHEHYCFREAYDLLLKERLICDKESKNTKLFLSLEIIIANVIHFASIHISPASIVSHKKDADLIYSEIRSLRNKLNIFNGIYCTFESKQHLLQYLVEDILSDQEKHVRSIYSSGMPRNLMRAIITKRLMFGLWMTFMKKDPTPRLIAKITLTMVSVFFNPMDISDATDIAAAIKENLIEDEKFRKQTIDEYLMGSLIKGAG